MRVIWSKVPSTSKYIIDKLRESSGWSPTTIKTLIGRLVKKNIIGFEAKKKTFYYYPLTTEEECIKQEMRMVIGRIYGSTLNKETPTLLFYGNNLPEYIEKLAYTLEENYERIAAELEYQSTEKVTVYIHYSIQQLHSALGVLNGPEWLRAGWTWGILHIVAPEYFADIPADKVAVHALAEIIIHKISPSAPFWLHQGVAAYEGRWLDKTWIKSILSETVLKNEIPSVVALASDRGTFGDNYGYVYTYTVADFIVSTFGYSKLCLFLKMPKEFKLIFNSSEAQFWEEWKAFLKENYINKER